VRDADFLSRVLGSQGGSSSVFEGEEEFRFQVG
jgi:hypothetical protein